MKKANEKKSAAPSVAAMKRPADKGGVAQLCKAHRDAAASGKRLPHGGAMSPKLREVVGFKKPSSAIGSLDPEAMMGAGVSSDTPAFETPRAGAVRDAEILQIPLEHLLKSDEARLVPPTAEDRKRTIASVKKHGVQQPLLVRKISVYSYCIADGCTRYDALKEMGAETAPCIVVRCEREDVRDIVLRGNYERRELNASQRVYAFFKLYPEELSRPLADLAWERKCAKTDITGMRILAGVSLDTLKSFADKKTNEIPPEVEEAYEGFRKLYEGKVRDGGLALRNVAAAIKGDMYARFIHEGAKPATKYAVKCDTAAAQYELAWTKWDEVALQEKADILEKTKAAFTKAPSDVRRELAAALWPDAFEAKKKGVKK